MIKVTDKSVIADLLYEVDATDSYEVDSELQWLFPARPSGEVSPCRHINLDENYIGIDNELIFVRSIHKGCIVVRRYLPAGFICGVTDIYTVKKFFDLEIDVRALFLACKPLVQFPPMVVGYDPESGVFLLEEEDIPKCYAPLKEARVSPFSSR